MLVTLNSSNFEYDIHSLVKAFFPREEVTVSVGNEPSFLHIDYLPGEGDPDAVVITLNPQEHDAEDRDARTDSEDRSTVKAPEGRNVAEVLKEPEAPDFLRLVTDFADRTATKNCLKQGLYRMMSSYTKESLPWGTLTGIRPTKIAMGYLEAGKSDGWIFDYMKDTYLASDEKIHLSIEVAKRERALLDRLDYQDGFSLYIGIPFCPSTCLYCSFTSYPLGLWKNRVEEYLDALEKELAFTAQALSDKKLNTVYIGGGTPTTLTPEQLDRLLGKIEQSFDFQNVLEYTVEAGRPDSITEEKLAVLRKHPVTRISINPQTMKQATLDLIGRRHSVEDTCKSFALARSLGFDNINMDLIVGLPEEDLADVRDTMEQIRKLGPDSLTVHSLAIKRAARLRMFREEYQNLTITNTWETIALTAEYARGMDLVPYYLYRQKNMAGNFENVGYAREGKEGLYNILIMEEKQSIFALGAGATTKYVYPDGRIERTENVKDIANYLDRIDEMIERKRQGIRKWRGNQTE